MGRVWLLALFAGLAVAGCAASGNSRPRADERILYCLDPARRAALVDAATRLAIPVPPPAELERWRGADFDRACNGLMAANGRQFVSAAPATPAWLTDLLTTLKSAGLLLVGGLLTLLTGGMRDAGTRRRLQAARLRTATDNFVAACHSFLDDITDSADTTASSQATRDRRQELRAKLRETQALYPRKVDSDPALQHLVDNLDRKIQRDWALSRTETERGKRMEKIKDALTVLTERTEKINRKLERSWLAWLGGAK